jgi:branched-chain amino acid transport system permease protein
MNEARVVVVNGALFGVIYGLFAIGLVIVYRGSRVINFAHGEIGMVGAFLFDELWRDRGVALGLALVAGIGFSAVVAGMTDRYFISPLRSQPKVNSLVVTIALSGLLLFAAGRRWGLRSRYTKPIIAGHSVNVLGVAVQPIQVLMLAASLMIVLLLVLLYEYTPFGLEMRAVALDPFAAGQVGVNVTRVSTMTWAMAGAIAATCGILISSQVAFNVGFMTPLLLRALTAAFIGGLTRPLKVFGAGVGLGVVEGLIRLWWPARGVIEVILAGLILVMLLTGPARLVQAEA